MASKPGLMLKREAADQRIVHLTDELRRRGVEVGNEPDPPRDCTARAVQGITRRADLIEAAANRIDALVAREHELTAELAGLRGAA